MADQIYGWPYIQPAPYIYISIYIYIYVCVYKNTGNVFIKYTGFYTGCSYIDPIVCHTLLYILVWSTPPNAPKNLRPSQKHIFSKTLHFTSSFGRFTPSRRHFRIPHEISVLTSYLEVWKSKFKHFRAKAPFVSSLEVDNSAVFSIIDSYFVLDKLGSVPNGPYDLSCGLAKLDS